MQHSCHKRNTRCDSELCHASPVTRKSHLRDARHTVGATRNQTVQVAVSAQDTQHRLSVQDLRGLLAKLPGGPRQPPSGRRATSIAASFHLHPTSEYRLAREM